VRLNAGSRASTEDAAAVLQRRLDRGDRIQGRRIVSVARRPSPSRSSWTLEEVDVELSGGAVVPMMYKDLGARLDQAVRAKPLFVADPLREVEVYRSGALGDGLAPTCHGWGAGERGGAWLFLERVPGVELSLVGDLGAWREAARMVAGMHARFEARPPRIPRLLLRDAAFYRRWPPRAERFLQHRGAGGATLAHFRGLVEQYGAVVDRLVRAPQTFVHGELYPSNVVVRDERAGRGRVVIVDWEMAGTGPGALDLAALASGRWARPERDAIVSAYLEEARRPDAEGSAGRCEFELLVDACRVHLAMQWLGWSSEWTPPPEHENDWLHEALEAGERLGL